MHFFILASLKYAKALRNIKQLNICTFLQMFKIPARLKVLGKKRKHVLGKRGWMVVLDKMAPFNSMILA
jgi:hypothetical protein